MNDFPPERVTLVQILAAVDSLFSQWPDPQACNPACFEVGTRQRHYLTGRGIAWRVGGSAEVRKGGERILSILEREGLITTHKTSGAHRAVALTLMGDDFARSLLGFYRVADCWNVLRGLAQAVQAGPGRWVTAKHVARGLGKTDERIGWAVVYPLLSHAFIESAVSSVGATVFTVPPKNWELAAGPVPELAADPPADERLNPIYWQAFDQAEAEKQGWKPRRENVVLIPVLN